MERSKEEKTGAQLKRGGSGGSRRHGSSYVFSRNALFSFPLLAVTYIDSSAVQALKDLHQEYKSRDIQLTISNPSREVLLTLARSTVVELIGKEWYFVRMHDAVQVCLQHVQSLNETPKASDSLPDHKPSFFQRLLNKREEDSSTVDVESGNKMSSGSKYLDPNLEPLLSRKS